MSKPKSRLNSIQERWNSLRKNQKEMPSSTSSKVHKNCKVSKREPGSSTCVNLSHPIAYHTLWKSTSIPIFWIRFGSYAWVWANVRSLIMWQTCISRSPMWSRLELSRSLSVASTSSMDTPVEECVLDSSWWWLDLELDPFLNKPKILFFIAAERMTNCTRQTRVGVKLVKRNQVYPPVSLAPNQRNLYMLKIEAKCREQTWDQYFKVWNKLESKKACEREWKMCWNGMNSPLPAILYLQRTHNSYNCHVGPTSRCSKKWRSRLLATCVGWPMGSVEPKVGRTGPHPSRWRGATWKLVKKNYFIFAQKFIL